MLTKVEYQVKNNMCNMLSLFPDIVKPKNEADAEGVFMIDSSLPKSQSSFQEGYILNTIVV